jgi:NAD(P)-dependent dehydrogenase (short-subunit alcohol dehydrogenase family)
MEQNRQAARKRIQGGASNRMSAMPLSAAADESRRFASKPQTNQTLLGTGNLKTKWQSLLAEARASAWVPRSDKTFNTNVRGLLFAVQKALHLLSQRILGNPHWLNRLDQRIRSVLCLQCEQGGGALSFARSWINDLKGSGIRVNVLSPGHIETPGLSLLMTEQQKASAAANAPLGRIGTPDDIARVAVFLASDDSRYVNGIELFADGGVAQY